eukprot:9218076-Alexandrium_andersonii.AAC.1
MVRNALMRSGAFVGGNCEQDGRAQPSELWSLLRVAGEDKTPPLHPDAVLAWTKPPQRQLVEDAEVHEELLELLLLAALGLGGG